jgi:Transposase, Mutator family
MRLALRVRPPGAAGHHRGLPGGVAFHDSRRRTRPARPRDTPAVSSQHSKRIRTTNLLERTFVEVRRRASVIGRFPGETSALSLIWAVLELSSRAWRGVKRNPRPSRRSSAYAAGCTPHAQPPAESTQEVIAAQHPTPAEATPSQFPRELGRDRRSGPAPWQRSAAGPSARHVR